MSDDFIPMMNAPEENAPEGESSADSFDSGELIYFIKLEEEIAGFYKKAGKACGKYPEFWDYLCDEEKKHAFLLKELAPPMDKKEIKFRETRFKIPTIEEARIFINRSAQRLQEEKMTCQEIFDLALTVEKRTIEGLTFQVFDDDDSPVAKEIFSQLVKESKEHQEAIEKMIDLMKEPRLLRGLKYKKLVNLFSEIK